MRSWKVVILFQLMKMTILMVAKYSTIERLLCSETVRQSCPRATFLGPDPTRRRLDPTRPAITHKKSDPTRPDPSPSPGTIKLNIQVAQADMDYYQFNRIFTVILNV